MTSVPDPSRLLPIDVRRAVLSVLFRAAGGPLSITEIVNRTRLQAGLDLAGLAGVGPRQRVSDILRHQVRRGRAEAVGRGRYLLFVAEFSESSRWRCLHWQQAAARRSQYPTRDALGRTRMLGPPVPVP
ncbi:MAG: hypothetical protein Q7V88_18775 [Actinomycetota bacterium]|nr:hypothetical protein [Actinomycetota bacterium]